MKINHFWIKKKIFSTFIDITLNKYYCLSMIPYPSGKLHIGHIRNYTISDIVARYNRMQGKNVLFPIAWDSFGLPAEHAAHINNCMPDIWTKKNIFNMKKELINFNFSYDWKREITTSSPNYCLVEQILFINLYKKGLIYRKNSLVNWCGADKTVLANEQVINNRCWRCNTPILKKYILQWFIKIDQYSLKLNNTKTLNNWPIKVKLMQQNWIKYQNLIFIILKFLHFNLNLITHIENIDFLSYTKFVFLQIKHPIIGKLHIKKNILFIIQNLKINFIFQTNIYLINPINTNYILIKITNYFLKKKIFSKIINNFKKKIDIFDLLKKNIIFLITYSLLKPWCISRQRHWGNSIPLFYNKNNIFTIPINQLPILVNDQCYYNKSIFNLNIKKNINLLINYKKNLLESDTLDTFVESAWYYLKLTLNYVNSKKLIKSNLNYWLPIDCYIGGIEHANMHLIYMRFFNKLFQDFDLISTNEPVLKLICQGIIIAHAFYFYKNNVICWINKNDINKKRLINNKIYKFGLCKISKSKNNGDDINLLIQKYNTDSIRLAIIFHAPIDKTIEWKESSITGMIRFLEKLKHYVDKIQNNFYLNINKFTYKNIQDRNKIYNYLYDINNLIILNKFNLVISKIMSLFKYIKNLNFVSYQDKAIILESIKILLRILYIFSPITVFNIWVSITKKTNIDFTFYPNMDKYI